MSSRYRKKRRAIANSIATFDNTQVKTEVSITTTLFKPPQSVKPIIDSTSPTLTVNHNVVSTTSINTINTVIFTLNNLGNLTDLYDEINIRINALIDMIISKRDIDTIIQYAKTVRGFISTRLETINDSIPSNMSQAVEIVNKLQYLVIDILDDIINRVEIGIVERRIKYVIELLAEIKNN
jgi:hypothetical protein